MIVTFDCVKYNSHQFITKMSFTEHPSMENCPGAVLGLISVLISEHINEHINYNAIQFIDMEKFRSFLTKKFVGVLAEWRTGYDGKVPSYDDRCETISDIPMWFHQCDFIDTNAIDAEERIREILENIYRNYVDPSVVFPDQEDA